MKIYLIGMPGSGKSTLGIQLAETLGLEFVDLDKAIENKAGISISQLFSEQGEAYFRQLESQELREWAGSEKQFVMATGGGAPCFYDGIEVINQSGLSIFLRVPVSVLMERIISSTSRPLLNAPEITEREAKLNVLYQDRLDCYRNATLTVEHPTLQRLMDVIQLRR